jgi:hypothetical protein
MGPADVREHCRLDEVGQRLIQAAMRQLHLSARAYHRVLKLARTIADLASALDIGPRTWPRRSSTGRGGWSRRNAQLGGRGSQADYCADEGILAVAVAASGPSRA